MVLFQLGIARQDNGAPVGSREMHIDHLNGFEFLQHCPRRQARSQSVQPAVQSHVQAVSHEGNENVRFDAILELMIDGADRQIPFEITAN